MSSHGVLVVDDEVKLCRNIALKLQKEGLVTYQAYDGKSAIDIVKQHPVKVVLLDYMLTDMTGLDVLAFIKKKDPGVVVYMLTAYGNIESAVMAMKLGASDYFSKPVELKRIKEVVMSLCGNLHKEEDLEDTIFTSNKMKQIRQLLDRVTSTDTVILLLGESGVGKTALAKWIHQHSNRKKNPFMSINCASIPESLLESELFGYNKGAFSGAMESRIGKFEAADGGTIFLDEIGEISTSMQAKLLHVIEEKSFMRLGSHTPQKLDVRIISATNKNLKQLVKEGGFREDLYYRLNLVEIEIPPLRERREDIPFLVKQKNEQLNAKYNRSVSVSAELMNRMIHHPWPGNIRELLNTLERMHLMKHEGVLEASDFPFSSESTFHPITIDEIHTHGRLRDVLDEVEERMIVEALQRSGGNQTKAADLLGISRNTLIYKMKKLKKL